MSLNLISKVFVAACGSVLGGLGVAGVAGHSAPWWVAIIVGAIGTAAGVLAQSPVDHDAIAERKAGGVPPAAVLLLLLGLASATACAPTDIEQGTTAEAALTTGTCNPAGNPPRSADVTYSSGTCARYSMSGSPLTQQNYVIPGPTLGTIVSVRTGSQAAAWVCDLANPIGRTQSPYAPCWSGGVNNGVQRVRGAYVNASTLYAGTSATITNVIGNSLVLTLGLLSGNLPACNSQAALHWHQFGGTFGGDSVGNSYTANNDPADGPGSQLTAAWPDGTSGSPCYSNQTPSGYGEVYYAAFSP